MMTKGGDLVKEFTSGIATDDVENEVNVEDIPDTPDQSDVDDEVYCIDLSFIDVQPLQTIYLCIDTTGTGVEGEQHLPQVESSDTESDEDDVPLSKKRKATIVPDIGPFKKKYKERTISEIAKIWGVSIKVAKEFSRQHNIQSIN